MKSSNLAVRVVQEDFGDAAAVQAAVDAAAYQRRVAERRARARRSFEYRAIVIRDQGLPSFRVR
jgi:hypothetical protein